MSDGIVPVGDLSVVGGGAVGLTCALAAADRGWRVRVFDAGPRWRAAHVAGGMLGCLAEGHPGQDRLLSIARDSVARWPALLARLDDPHVRVATDSLLIGATPADVEHLRSQVGFLLSQAPSDAERLIARTARELRTDEPALVRGTAGGFRAVGEGAVDNREFIAALHRSLDAAGVERVAAEVTDLSQVPGDQVLVAAGLGTRRLLPEVDLRGEKGEILRLRRTRWSVPPPRHVIRARWHGRPVYLAPRADGLVLGATQYEAYDDADRAPLAGGVADLLADAGELMPGLRTYELAEAGAGIRPSSPDGVPVVSRIDDRITVAAGHGRNGVALAPWTADRFVDLLDEARNGSANALSDKQIQNTIDTGV
ncbi:MAG: FAD-dependent oxidoreductase [Gordonia sp. (in: high G+C Gram-positive bacteria)]|uniref:FAD-dependent oxidoreductase n=1 Tax=Gordonia sp. (in: high G+C Gram-positive bacteria) TaxID=84139 RepID=UPI003C769C78